MRRPPQWVWPLLLCIVAIIPYASPATIETVGLDRVDWEIIDFGVVLYPTYEDAAGQRQRLPNLFFEMRWTHVGMWAPWESSSSEMLTPWLNISLASGTIRSWNETYKSIEGNNITRWAQESVVRQNQDGSLFTFRIFFDLADQPSNLQYVGFKMPLSPRGMKITTEIEHYPTKNETSGLPLERPAPFAMFNTHVKSQLTKPVSILDTGTYPLMLEELVTDLERFPGYPAWLDYPTSNTLDDEPRSGRVSLRDDRCNLTLTLLQFSSTNYTGTKPNHSPDGIVPVDSGWRFWPKADVGISFFTDYALSLPEDRVRETVLYCMYFFKSDTNKGIGTKVVWDPDLTVLFTPTNEPTAPTDTMSYAAIAGGVVAGVVVVATGAAGLIWYRRNKQYRLSRLDAIDRMRVSQLGEDAPAPAPVVGAASAAANSSPSPAASNPTTRSTWNRFTIIDRKSDLKDELA